MSDVPNHSFLPVCSRIIFTLLHLDSNITFRLVTKRIKANIILKISLYNFIENFYVAQNIPSS